MTVISRQHPRSGARRSALGALLLVTAATSLVACGRTGLERGEVRDVGFDGDAAAPVTDVVEDDVLPEPDIITVDIAEEVTPDGVDPIDVLDEPDVPPAECGNGIVEAGEACDDGFANSDTIPNACRTDCSEARCGDGVVDQGEACDPAAEEPALGCSDECLLPATVCAPCDGDQACGRADDVCMDLLDGTFCGVVCATDADCADGLSCEDVRSVSGARARQCVPAFTICSECFDQDGDGYGIGVACLGPDCNDRNPAISPAALEICDDIDNDCDGDNDEGCPPDLIVDGERIELAGDRLYDRVTVRNGGVVVVPPPDEATFDCTPDGPGCLRIEARVIEVLDRGRIDASGAGRCARGLGDEAGFGAGLQNTGPAGGGYGGRGGAGPGLIGAAPYGTPTGEDIAMGGPGGGFTIVASGFDGACDDLVGLESAGGFGGGCVELRAPDVTIAGQVLANGEPGEDAPSGRVPAIVDAGAGGAGGGIRIVGRRVTIGPGALLGAEGGDGGVGGTYSPNGGAGANESCIGNGGGGGGGGRIKVSATVSLQSRGAVRVQGGAGGEGPQSDASAGEQGSVFLD